MALSGTEAVSSVASGSVWRSRAIYKVTSPAARSPAQGRDARVPLAGAARTTGATVEAEAAAITARRIAEYERFVRARRGDRCARGSTLSGSPARGRSVIASSMHPVLDRGQVLDGHRRLLARAAPDAGEGRPAATQRRPVPVHGTRRRTQHAQPCEARLRRRLPGFAERDRSRRPVRGRARRNAVRPHGSAPGAVPRWLGHREWRRSRDADGAGVQRARRCHGQRDGRSRTGPHGAHPRGRGGSRATTAAVLDTLATVRSTTRSPTCRRRSPRAPRHARRADRHALADVRQRLATRPARASGRRRTDLIVAANIVHATPVLATTLANLRSVLTPGGRLVLLEATTRRISTSPWATPPGW